MARSLNQVALVGRLTRDAELKYSGAGKAYCQFSIAVDDGWGQNEHTSFFDCVTFGKTAEALAKYLVKGKQVGVAGSLKQERWQAQDGSNRSKVSVSCNDIQLLGSKGESGPSSSFEDDDLDAPF